MKCVFIGYSQTQRGISATIYPHNIFIFLLMWTIAYFFCSEVSLIMKERDLLIFTSRVDLYSALKLILNLPFTLHQSLLVEQNSPHIDLILEDKRFDKVYNQKKNTKPQANICS